MLDGATISMGVGAQVSIPYTATKPDPADPTNPNKSVAFNLTGYTLRFTLKTTPDGGTPYVLQKDSSGGGVTISDAPNGLAAINFVSSDTLALAPGVYYFDVVAVNGATQVPLTGGAGCAFVLKDRVSR